MLANTYFDRITSKLETIPWLSTAYGPVTLKEDKNKGTYPAIWNPEQGDYLNLEADGDLGNYTYIETHGVTETKSYLHAQYFKQKFTIVLFFNWGKVFSDPNGRTIEEVKEQVLTKLRGLPLNVNRIEERRLYREYTNREKEQQYQMRPCGGLRIDCLGSYNSLQSACADFTACPVTSITGIYRNIELALANTSDGEYFALTKDNDHGTLNYIYQLNPSVSFATEDEAAAAIGFDRCFAYADGNPKGYFLKSSTGAYAGLVAIKRQKARVFSNRADADASELDFYYYFNPDEYGGDNVAFVNKKGL